ncbi:MAG: FkbM family methyltransferase [Reyranella sp.]|uniref:FkbM family methyltransferase n=1 Tax=Reyranella sp. TaxID=1929291 RepID=UPI001ACE0761|nr:FkbM family methyltransferase [Reyranella sp.]MBN9089183.1 FkbM family methyltransferase [Reyranella sp.]
MRIATNLSELDRLGTYRLHPDNDDARFLQQAIQRLLPDAEFAGYVNELSGDLDTVITVDSRWRQALAGGAMPKDLVVFPAIDVVGWEFWHFGRQIIDRCIAGKPAILPMSAFVDFLARWEPPTVKKNGDDHYTLLAGDEYYTKDVAQRQVFKSAAEFVRSQLDNEESRRAYETAFQGSPMDVWTHYVGSVFSKTQYGQYIDVQPGHCVLSIGIDEGMELPWLCARLQGEGQIHAIDPFGMDFLSRYVWQTVKCFPGLIHEQRLAIGGYNGEAKLPYWSTMASGSLLNKEFEGTNHVTVPCLTVDEFVRRKELSRVDLIKIDIEGGEEFMIEGMYETIRTHRPQIAIAIYHTYHHLWSLPLRLMALCPDYRFYLDHYGFKKWDTVFYAVPAERVQAHYQAPPQPLLVLK